MRASLFALSCWLLIVTGANANTVEWSALHGLGKVDYFTLSRPLDDDKQQLYHIFVRVPENASEAKKTGLPSLVMLDGGTNFPLMAAYYQHLHFMQDIPTMLVVGISYGGLTWQQGNNRSHDYTLPSEEHEYWGGAPAFERMLIELLLPKLEQDFNADPNRHILFGQSLGGQFGLYVSHYGKAPFYGVIASNPALHRNLDLFLRPISRTNSLPKTFISMAEFDAERFRTPALAWRRHWQDKAPQWQRQVADLPGHNHLSANPEVLRNGLKWLLPAQ